MKPVSAILVCVVTTTLVVLFCLPVCATQIHYRSARELGSQSKLVVRGHVVGVRSYWNEKQTKIFTETTIATDESYKGKVGATVKLTQLGGTVGNTKVTVSGALHWREGEEVLLFLEPYTADTYHVSGFSQGKFNIERDPATGAAFVRQAPAGDAQMLGAPSQSSAATRTPSKVSLDQLLNQALGQR
jgi:hypothetical protein